MKQFYFLTTLFLISVTKVTSQTPVELFTDLNRVYSMASLGDYIYFSDESIIFKFDATATNPNIEIVAVVGLTVPNGLAFKGNDLYFVQSSGNKVSKIDVTDTFPTVVDVITTGLNVPYSLVFNGNDLYISEYSGNRISKIDISATTPTLETIISSGLNGPRGMVLDGNIMYVANSNDDKISKFDITDTTPLVTDFIVSANVNDPTSILLNEDELYVDDFFRFIQKFNISGTTPTIESTVLERNANSKPQAMILHGNDLYYSSLQYNANLTFTFGKIFKLDLSTLSINDSLTVDTFKVVPNPSSDFIQLKGLKTNQVYEIYNILGEQLSVGTVFNNQKIDIQNLTNGMYLLKFKDGNIAKFIKK